MNIDVSVVIPIAAAALAFSFLVAAIQWSHRRSRPDEWLLCIRNGKLVAAGIGISVWRRPGDVLVGFSSTVQRVSFQSDARTADRFNVAVDGFVLWSVSHAADAPLRAFGKLGLTELRHQPADMRQRRHLLTTPQHRAFRKLITAEVRRLVATLGIDDVLSAPDTLVEALSERLRPLFEDLGLYLDQVQVTGGRTVDASVMNDLAAEHLEKVREEGARLRLEASERTRHREIESETRLALEDTAARQERSLADAKVKLAEQKAETEVALARDAKLAAIEAQKLQRELAAARARAEAERDAIVTVAEAQEAKSAALREYELQQLTIEKLSAALEGLPLHEAKWVSVGQDSPLSGLAGLISGLQAAAHAKRD